VCALNLAGFVLTGRLRSGAQAEPSAQYTFNPVAEPPNIAYGKTWRLIGADGHRLHSVFTLTNFGAGTATTSHFEVVTKTVAPTVGSIRLSLQPTEVVERDPVVRFDLTRLGPGDTMTVVYDVDLP